jgi:hypothetical protein
MALGRALLAFDRKVHIAGFDISPAVDRQSVEGNSIAVESIAVESSTDFCCDTRFGYTAADNIDQNYCNC